MGGSEVKYCGVWMAEHERNGVVDLAAVTIMIPDKCGRRLETVRVGECVLTQPAITITGRPSRLNNALRARRELEHSELHSLSATVYGPNLCDLDSLRTVYGVLSVRSVGPRALEAVHAKFDGESP